MWDVFISYASADRDLAGPLAAELRRRGLKVWDDETMLAVGDSLLIEIDKGIAASRFGVAIVSASYFARKWTQRELGGFAAREDAAGKVILPIWHGVSPQEVAKYSPLLAGRKGISSEEGIHKIADRIEKVVKERGASSKVRKKHRSFSTATGEKLPARPAVAEAHNQEERMTWRSLWMGAAPVPVIAAVQWVIGVYILHFVSLQAGMILGGLSPLWLLPLGYLIGRYLPGRRILAPLVGAVVGAMIGGGIGFLMADWAARYGWVWGAFFIGILASYWSDPAKQMKGVWAIFWAVLLISCLGVFDDLEYYSQPAGICFLGTALVTAFWALVASGIQMGFLPKIKKMAGKAKGNREESD